MISLRHASLAFAAFSVIAPLCLVLSAEIGTHHADIAMGRKVCGMAIMAAMFFGAVVSAAASFLAVVLAVLSRRRSRRDGAKGFVSSKLIAAMALGPVWFFLLNVVLGSLLRLWWDQP